MCLEPGEVVKRWEPPFPLSITMFQELRTWVF